MKSLNPALWNSVNIVSPTCFNEEFLKNLPSQNKTGSAMALELTQSFGGGDMERILGGESSSFHGDSEIRKIQNMLFPKEWGLASMHSICQTKSPI